MNSRQIGIFAVVFALLAFGARAENLITNGSFEGGDTSKLHELYKHATFASLPGGWGSTGSAGWAQKGTWYTVNPYDANGKASASAAAAFMQCTSVISNTFETSILGTYTVSYYVVMRTSSYYNQQLTTYVDDQVVIASYKVPDNNAWQLKTGTLNLKPGKHVFKIVGASLDGNDRCSAIDLVSVELTTPLENCISVEGEPANYAVEGQPPCVYYSLEDGEVRTFTAPDFYVDETEIFTMKRLGYKIGTYDVETGTWSIGDLVDSGTYTHTQVGKAVTRLIWQWEKVTDEYTFTGASGGSWFVPDNWSSGRVPEATNDVVISGKSVVANGSLIAARRMTVMGAGALTLGNSSHTTNVTANITSNLVLKGNSKLTVYAGELPDYSTIFSNETQATHAIYTNANVVTVGGTFRVDGGSTVYPVNANLSATPVIFSVTGDVTVAEGALFDTRSRGWGWSGGAYADRPKGGKGRNLEGSAIETYGWTVAFGPGRSYGMGGGYGGHGYWGESTWNGWKYAYRYGSPYAPFLPGSPAGFYKGTGNARGSGSICILSSGLVAIDGTLNANAASTEHSGASGGGIWVAGRTVTLGTSALLTANGMGTGSAMYGPGGGGRIAIVQGAKKADLDKLAENTLPEGFDCIDLSGTSVSVAPGAGPNKSTGQVAGTGTAKIISKANAFATVTVCGSPLQALGVVYGSGTYPVGENTFTAPSVADHPSYVGTVRFVCAGYVVSNSVGEVKSGETTTCTFDLDGDLAPYTVTWLWGNQEVLLTVALPNAGLGTLAINGEARSAAVSEWIEAGKTLTVAVTPGEGNAFNCWQGDVARGEERLASLTMVPTVPITLTPYLYTLGSPQTRNWGTNKSGDWFKASNWAEGVVPSPEDTANIGSGTCTAKQTLRAGSIVLSGSAALNVSDAEQITVASNLTLRGSSKMTVYGRETDATHTYATGTAEVKVGNDLSVEGTSVLYSKCDSWTGGAPVFWVAGRFYLSTNASVNSHLAGWNWRVYTGSPSPLAKFTEGSGGIKFETMALSPGYSFNYAASHGGLGDQASLISRKVYGVGATEADYGNAPIYPGSPNGNYSTVSRCPGGGVVRIHAGTALVCGSIDASSRSTNADYDQYAYGGGSGGSIWLTTVGRIDFGTNATLRAKGGYSNYDYSRGGGGRIAVGAGLSWAQVMELATTGRCSARPHVKMEARFHKEFPGVTVDVKRGNYYSTVTATQNGTFRYYANPRGTMLLVR